MATVRQATLSLAVVRRAIFSRVLSPSLSPRASCYATRRCSSTQSTNPEGIQPEGTQSKGVAKTVVTASFPKGGSGLQAGDYALLRRTFSDQDVRAFACVTGDANAIHLDDTAAAQSIFKERVVHGMLSSSLFSAIFGSHIPGSIYLNQTLSFKRPVYLNKEITAKIEVVNVRGRVVKCNTTVVDNDDEVAIEGSATVLLPS